MSKKHKLGFGHGSIIEFEDGTAGWRAPATLSQAFRVKISDVTGFSVSKGNKMLERQLNILGNGTLLGTASVNHGTAEVIEKWFRAHPAFDSSPQGARSGGAAAASPTSVADEIQKLAGLRESGVLSDEEFAAAKQRLLGT